MFATSEYLDQLTDILKTGTLSEDRTGTGTISKFGLHARYPVNNVVFPLVTTKKVFWRGVVGELLWMLRGDTNVRSLQLQGIHIWDEWADANGNLGPVYGAQWRSWRTADGDRIDQLGDLIRQIRENPTSRRHILQAWNVGELSNMALPPCHMMAQFHVNNGKLSCQMYQRSADMFLGVPFNIASYALLTMIVARLTDLEPAELFHAVGNGHIYLNHIEQVKEQLSRAPVKSPRVELDDDMPLVLSKITPKHIRLIDYQPHPTIRAEVSI